MRPARRPRSDAQGRRAEAFKLIERGLTNAEVARAMGIKVRTVERYRQWGRRMLARLACKP
jgi:DNA-binding CsgD family transcriptional regulator